MNEFKNQILALDLGTKTGYAVGSVGVITEIGTRVLMTDKQLMSQRMAGDDRNSDARIRSLLDLILEYYPKYIVFEDVQFASTTDQAQLWGSLRGVIWYFAQLSGTKVLSVPVGTLKLYATGSGKAEKEDMKAALLGQRLDDNSQHMIAPVPNIDKLDDNAVDAAWLFFYIVECITGTKSWTESLDARLERKRKKRNLTARRRAQKIKDQKNEKV